MYSQLGHRCQYGACTLHTGYLRPHIHSGNITYLLIFHCNNGSTNVAQRCYMDDCLGHTIKRNFPQC